MAALKVLKDFEVGFRKCFLATRQRMTMGRGEGGSGSGRSGWDREGVGEWTVKVPLRSPQFVEALREVSCRHYSILVMLSSWRVCAEGGAKGGGRKGRSRRKRKQ